MKTIVHVIPRGYIEGRAYQENILPRKHLELGYEVHIVTSQLTRSLSSREIVKNTIGEYVNKDGVVVHVLQIPSKIIRYLRGICCIDFYNTICEIQPDIIFLHNVNAGENRYIVSYVRKHPNTLVYADCHEDYYNTPNKTIKAKIKGVMSVYYAKLLEPYVKMFWGTTPWRVDYLIHHYKFDQSKVGLLIMGGDEKIINSNNSVREEIRSQYKIPENAFIVVTGGIIDKRKHQDLLMEAIAELESDNVWLLIFGKPTKDMEKICDEYAKKQNIIFTGWVDADYSYKLLLASDLAVFPGTHSVLWEQAAACGLPQIIRHWSGMEHINVNGNALLLDDINVNSLKASIKETILPNKYQELKEKAEKAAPFFYYNEIAKRSIEI